MTKIFSIWHSNQSFESFLEKIKDIDLLVDVRSVPRSKYVPHFNRKNFEEKLWSKYIYMWDSLWWFDDIEEGKFLEWISELIELIKENKVVFMCTEKDYTKCHRFMKITPELEKRWLEVIHLW